MTCIAQQIEDEVRAWPRMTTEPHRFGGVEFRVDGHEIGHVHGNQLADLLFPVRMRKQLVAEGRAAVHHILPDSGWVSYYIRGDEDVAAVVALFRLNYERIRSQPSSTVASTSTG